MNQFIRTAQHKATGGIHPPERKSLTSNAPLRVCSIPNKLYLPLAMHAGEPAKALVKIGEHVKAGQIIAQLVDAVSANIHAPVDAVVEDIGIMRGNNATNTDELTMILAVTDANSNLVAGEYPTQGINWSSLSQTYILEQIKSAGIVGLGGAVFPTSAKINHALSKVHTLVVNGAECEPYISCDDCTMQNYTSEIITGAQILAHALGIKKVQIAIEDNKPDAIKLMAKELERIDMLNDCTFEVVQFASVYPSGGEKQLIEILTGHQVPKDKYPAALGYLIQNVGTLVAIYDAVIHQQPLTKRVVTVTGEAVEQPGNYLVTLGTPINHLLAEANWQQGLTNKLIHGGPMMGYLLEDAERPVIKSTNCIIAGTEQELPDALPERPCIRCGQCADVCPASLAPQQLFWFSRSEEYDKAEQFDLFDCIECGACAYVCPSHIPLVDYYRHSKSEIRSQRKAKLKAEQAKVRFDRRNQRLEAEALEKKRKRAERAERAKLAKSQTSAVDPNQQAVADALARVKAKKATQAKTDEDNDQLKGK
jgi:Na+-translocating ferredoxin:NAD+ oxidoreductase subunit C